MGAVKIINTQMWHRFQGCGLAPGSGHSPGVYLHVKT
ncbi:hypothetical protein NC652_015314 [Populus alba x Populus x berolinensis]|nr:hypothetical protein NC652_015314 [Populus alba x Populus x berolinensis]